MAGYRYMRLHGWVQGYRAVQGGYRATGPYRVATGTLASWQGGVVLGYPGFIEGGVVPGYPDIEPGPGSIDPVIVPGRQYMAYLTYI